MNNAGQEYVMVGIMDSDNGDDIVKVLAKGPLDHCMEFQVENEMDYLEFKIYKIEDFAEIANHVSIN